MSTFLLALLTALVFSAVGFKRYVWFISIGYGASIAAIGLFLLIRFSSVLTPGTALLCLLFLIYGCRLAGYLWFREMRSSTYNSKMKTEIKDGKTMSITAKCAIWISAALLYVCETSPVIFRLMQGKKTNPAVIIGAIVMVLGLCIESVADLQKNKAKKANPNRFVDTGLFRFVRCPNYLGEMLFWTGVFISGFGAVSGLLQWICVLIGYLGIIYVMFGGARRLEIRQNRTYGSDPDYQAYVKSTPIMVPFIPLYSVAKYKWLVA